MIVGHCPECGMAILADSNGTVQACSHTTAAPLIVASLFGIAFAPQPQSDAAGRIDDKA